jgi:uncharacterized membrane protein
VEIPAGAANNNWSQAAITAASQNDSSKTDASVLTTTAIITRGVKIEPPDDAQTGDAGQTVTYTLRVTNTGNIADLINLTVTANWTTTLSDNSLNLNSNQGQTIYVYVEAPSGGISDGDKDTATVTAKSNADPSQTDSSVLTTTAFVPTYGVELTPPTANTTENPGQIVTYTLTLRNTGNTTDTYNITKLVTGQAWTTTIPGSVGPVASGNSAQFNVTVEIPAGAANNNWSRAAVTAASQNDSSKTDASVLTTTAATAIITRGVNIERLTEPQTGEAGKTVTYTLRVTNTGTAADTIVLTATGQSWPTGLSDYSLSLNSDQGQTVYAYVAVPSSGISDGDKDTATVTAKSNADPSKTDSAVLTTTAYVPTYDVDLSPNTAIKTDNPGQTVTYTMFVENTGNIADSYTLSLGTHIWTATLSVNTIGPLDPGDPANFDVTVIIPAGASNGQQDTTLVTATSTTDPAISDASLLTTVATTQTIIRGVTLEPSTDAKTGGAGATVTYTLRVTNTGNVVDTISLEPHGNAWETDVSPTSVSLSSQGSSPVIVAVTIPGDANDGQFDVATITAQGSGASDAAVLTTTAAVAVCTDISNPDFDFAPAAPQVGQTVAFTGSVGAGTPPITYAWDFDDGNTGSGENVSHTFPSTVTTQVYNVTMTAANTCPSEQVVSKPVTVRPRYLYLPIVLKE